MSAQPVMSNSNITPAIGVDSVIFLAGKLLQIDEFTTRDGERRYEHHISRPARDDQSAPMKFAFVASRKFGAVGTDVRAKCEALSYRKDGKSRETGKVFTVYNVRFVAIEA